MDKQLARTPAEAVNTAANSARIEERKHMLKVLPSYFHNLTSRHCVGIRQHEQILRSHHYHTLDLGNPRTTINVDRKEFRIDPETQLPVGKANPKKERKSLCFNNSGVEPTFYQIMKKKGFCAEPGSKKPRERPWHIAKPKNLDELDEDFSDS